MNRLAVLTATLFSALALAAGPTALERAKQVFKPLPRDFATRDAPVTAARVELGKQLFFEKRLSKTHDVSCNSCHDVTKFGVDGTPTSTGHKQQKGGRNAPTVYNAGNHLAQFWDGRAATLEDQAKGPVLNPIEMALPDEAAAVAVLKSIPAYGKAFQKAFPGEKDAITFDNFAKAVGAYERTLVTPSRFDAFLAGDAKALTAAEQAGLTAFMDTGCTACHSGEGLGGHMYQKLGLVFPVKDLADKGRFEATKNPGDTFFFKVPSLRNIEKTAPYLHDGSIATLPEMVTFMAKHQLGRDLKAEETASIVTFLRSLTGTLPAKAITTPKPFPSGKATPRPDPS